MGAQTTETTQTGGLTEIKYDNYLFQIKVLSEKEIGLEIVDSKTFQIFSLESHVFQTQVNSSTLIAALNRKEEQNLKLSMSHGQNSEKEHFFKIVLRVTYDFIPHFEEALLLPIKKGVNEKDMIHIQMKLINNEIRSLQNSIDSHSKTTEYKHATQVKSGTYNGANHSICKLELPKGKYELNLSFYTLSNQNWIYLKLTNSSTGTDVLKLPEGGYYFTVANASLYQPHIIRAIVDVKDDKQTFSLDSQACNSYPWNMKNLILSATQI